MNDLAVVEELRFANEKKTVGMTYLLWFLLAWAGGHKFYLDRRGMGFAYLGAALGSVFLLVLGFAAGAPEIVYLSVLGYLTYGVAVLVDLFTIPSQVRKRNEELRQEIRKQLNGSAEHYQTEF